MSATLVPFTVIERRRKAKATAIERLTPRDLDLALKLSVIRANKPYTATLIENLINDIESRRPPGA